MLMQYYVLDDQGNRYGPADLPTLNTWIRQGRIVPNTQILIENTGKVVPATMVPGIHLETAPGIGADPTQAMPRGLPGAPGPGPQGPGYGQSWQQPPGRGAFGGGGGFSGQNSF